MNEAAVDPSAPWYRSVSSDQWLAFWATMSGWILDAFDYNILAIILIDIQKSFTVDAALAGRPAGSGRTLRQNGSSSALSMSSSFSGYL